MKKKLLALAAGIITVVMAFSFAACASNDEEGKKPNSDDTDITQTDPGNETLGGNSFKTFKFEAEDTYVMGIKGGNFSSNPTGKDLIIKDSKNLGASNGYFVGSLSNPDAEVEFEITSDKAVSNVKLVVYVSSNTYNFTLSPDSSNNQYYKIAVNGEAVTYTPFKVTANEKFKAIELGNISLIEGDNTITFTTSNKYSPTSGIFAAAPAIDCIVLTTDSDVKLEQEVYDGNY